jgi:hypothetical protein
MNINVVFEVNPEFMLILLAEIVRFQVENFLNNNYRKGLIQNKMNLLLNCFYTSMSNYNYL